MATNWDEVVAGTGDTSPSVDWDKVVDNMDRPLGVQPQDESTPADPRRNHKRLQATLGAAREYNPDEMAELARIGKQFSLTPEVVRDTRADLEEHLARRQTFALPKRSPGTASFLSNFDSAAMSHDVIPELEAYEAKVSGLKSGWKMGSLQDAMLSDLQEEMWGAPSIATQARLTKQRAEMAANAPMSSAAAWTAYQTSYAARQFVSSTREAIKGGMLGAMGGTGVALTIGQLGPQAALPEELLSVPALAFRGGQIGAVGAAARYNYLAESSFAWDEFSRLRDSRGVGVSQDAARGAAVVAGVLNSGLETAADVYLAQLIPGLSAMTRVARRAAISTLLKQPSYQQAFARVAGLWVKGGLVEGVTEGIQELPLIAGDVILEAFSGREVGAPDARQAVKRVLASAGQAAVGTWGAFGIPAGASYASAAMDVASANERRDGMLALGEGAKASTLRERMPEEFQKFVEHVKAGGPVDEVAIPVERWNEYFQKAGLDPAAVATEVTGSAAAYDQAITAGVDLRIPLERYATLIAPTEHNLGLVEDMRLHPNEPTLREARDFEKKFKEVAEQMQAEMPGPSAEDAAGEVYASIYGQLQAAGMDESGAGRHAQLWQRAFNTIGQRMGISPAELFQRFPPTIRGQEDQDEEQAGGTVLEQIEPDTPEFKAWFGASKVVSEDSKPLVVYHGTARSFRKFRGVSYFTDDPSFAEAFAAGPGSNTMPVYLRMDNPAILDGNVEGRHFRWDAEDVAGYKAAGHDGVIIKTAGEATIYAVFDGKQVKSAVGNVGTYSRDTPDILLQAEAQTGTPEFKNWFGASKAVDETGNPLVMYHGTANDIVAFDDPEGVYATPNPEYASVFAASAMEQQRDPDMPAAASNVVAVFVAIENPLDLRGLGTDDVTASQLVDEFIEQGMDQDNAQELYRKLDSRSEDDTQPAWFWMRQIVGELKSIFALSGFDGFIQWEENAGGKAVAYWVPDAAQVKSAISNRGTFDPNDARILYQRTSDLGHKRVASSGRYVGAPDWIGNDSRQLTSLRTTLRKLAEEGLVGKYWYEESARKILEMVGGDKDAAEKFIGLIAIYSANTNVSANMTHAMKAWHQWKLGLPITAGRFPATQGPKAEAWLNRGEDFSGIKVNNFYTDLMEEIDPSKVDLEHSTMDMWMAIAFDYGAKVLDQGPKYKFAQREIAGIAKKMGVRPHQVQAAIWTAIKARVEGSAKQRRAYELKNGIGQMVKKRDEQTGKMRTLYEITPGREYDHFRAAHRFGIQSKITQAEIDESNYDFSHALTARSATLSWEATPGVASGILPGIHEAPVARVKEYLAAIRQALSDSQGRDRVDVMLGLLTNTGLAAPSGWAGKTTQSIQQQVGVPIVDGKVAGASRILVNLAADIRGLLLSQDAVAWHFPIYNGAKFAQNGIEFNIGRPLTDVETDVLYQALTVRLGHSNSPPIPTTTGFRVLNFTDEKDALLGETDKRKIQELQAAERKANRAFHAAVADVVAEAEFLPELPPSVLFETDGELRNNDWSTGDAVYKKRISEAQETLASQADGGGSRFADLQGWIDDELHPLIAAVNRDFAERYGWDEKALELFQLAEPIFFSALLRSAETAQIEKATAEQWLGTLRNMPGVKEEEIRWTLLEPWLKSQTGAITKETVTEYLRANQITVNEVLGGDEVSSNEDTLAFAQQLHRDSPLAGTPWARLSGYNNQLFLTHADEALSDSAASRNLVPTKFAKWQVPGGKQYRELLLTLPTPEEKQRQVSVGVPHLSLAELSDSELAGLLVWNDSNVDLNEHDPRSTLLAIADGMELTDDDVVRRAAEQRGLWIRARGPAGGPRWGIVNGEGELQAPEFLSEEAALIVLRAGLGGVPLEGRDGLGGAPEELSAEDAVDYTSFSPDDLEEGTTVLLYPSTLWILKLPDGQGFHVLAQNDDRIFDTLPRAERYLYERMRDEIDIDIPRSTLEVTEPAPAFRGGHWDVPNVVVHVRFNDRVDEDGKKTLFLEEVQSDYAQLGRRRGFNDPTGVIDFKIQSIPDVQMSEEMVGYDRTSVAAAPVRVKRWEITSAMYAPPTALPHVHSDGRRLLAVITERKPVKLTKKSLAEKLREHYGLDDVSAVTEILWRHKDDLSSMRELLVTDGGFTPEQALKFMGAFRQMHWPRFEAVLHLSPNVIHPLGFFDSLWSARNKVFDSRVYRRGNADAALGGFDALYLSEHQAARPHKDELPAAPFVTRTEGWSSLAMKRMVRWAAENGYDQVAWTPGNVQSERYDLSKHVDSVTLYVRAAGDGYNINAHKNKRLVVAEHAEDEAALEGLVGKDIADKLLAQLKATKSQPRLTALPAGYKAIPHDDGEGFVGFIVPDPFGGTNVGEGITEADAIESALNALHKSGPESARVSGAGLKIGGRGMIAFYDKILVGVANKLGKKFGVKVVEIKTDTGEKIKVSRMDVKAAARKYMTGNYSAEEFNDLLGVEGLVSENDLEGFPSSTGHSFTDNRNLMAITDLLMEKMSQRVGSIAAHALPITQAMRESVLAGQPLFQDKKRGKIRIGPRVGGVRPFEISLFREANRSTFLHETGHYLFEVLADLAENPDAPQQIKDDYATMLAWLGVKSRDEIKREHHELMARGFEAYLMEGKAPSTELRSAFARFALWLKEIYKAVRNLNVEISDEVRAVMDRLLATDEEIANAEQQQEMVPLFTSAEEAGMSPERWAVYREAAAAARVQAQEHLNAQMMAVLTREQTAWWREETEKMRAIVAHEVYQRRVYRALAFLQLGEQPDRTPLPEGVTPAKLNREALVAQFGEDYLKTLPRPYLYSKEGGVHHDVVADMFGYASGDEMLQEILQAPKMKQAIEAETVSRLREQHGDPLIDGSIAERAMEAVHNDRRAELMVAELRGLRRKVADLRPFVAAALNEQDRLDREAREANLNQSVDLEVVRAAADRMIDGANVQDIKPQYFLAAERRAAKRAFERAAAGDYAAAAFAQQQRIFNHELYRAALEAREVVEKFGARMRRYDDNKVRGRMGLAGGGYLEQIDNLREQYDFSRMSIKAGDRRTTFAAWIAEREAAGLPVAIPESVRERALRIPYKQLRYGDLKDLRDAVINIEHLAKLKNKLLNLQEEREYLDVRDSVVASIDRHHQRTPESMDFTDDWKKRVQTNTSQFFAEHAKPEFLFTWLDGEEELGPVWTALFKPVADAEADEQKRFRAAREELAKIFDRYSLKERQTLFLQKVSINGMTVTRAQILAAALNTGNEYNLDVLKRGYNWTDQQLDAVLAKLDDRDIDTVQMIWDLIDSFWPEVAALQKDLTGLAPEKVKARPFTFPGGRTLRGGYYPLRYEGYRAEARDEKLSVEQAFGGQWAHAQTKQGHTKARTDSGGQRVQLNLGVFTDHIVNVIHDLTHRRAVLDVDRLINDSEIRDAITATAGEQMYKQLKPWLQNIAADFRPPTTGTEKAINRARNGASIVNMGWKITTAIVQPLGYLQTVDLIGPKYAAIGLRDFYVGNPLGMRQRIDFVLERSEQVRNRLTSYDRDVRDQLKGFEINTNVRNVKRTFFLLTGLMDMSVTIPSWLGAYRKAMDGAVDGVVAGNEGLAIDYADSVVRRSQSAGGAKDLSRIQQREGLLRLLTVFYSYFNGLHNLMRRQIGMTRKVKDIPRLVASMFLLWIIPAVLSEIIAGRGPDDGEDWDKWAKRTAYLWALYPLSTIVMVRDLVAGMGPYGYDLTPAADAFESLSGVLKEGWTQVIEEDEEFTRADLKKVVSTIGYWGQLPTRQMWITGSYLFDWASGEEQPETIGEAISGLAFARKGK